MAEYADVEGPVLTKLRAIMASLPETEELEVYAGVRWVVRRKTIAWVVRPERLGGDVTILQFRSAGDELDALVRGGHPFHQAGWGSNVVNMVIDDATDWDEVRELMTESYCIQAPKKLAALIQRPEGE